MNNDTLLIKQKNFQKIHALFFQYPVISKPRIVQLLGLSTPTVSTHITELLNQKLIQPSSSMQSQNGRPAIGYSLVPDAKVAFGVEIKFNQVRCAVVDLVGHATNIQEFPLPCSDQANYLEKFCTTIKSYIQAQAYTPEQILGIGISVQAVVNAEGSEMIYSRILPLKTLKAADLSREFALPVRLCHDVECSALSELWFDQNLSDAVYVSIAEHLGGALILNHRIEYGKVGYAGALEHLPCGTEGRKCYCGRQDCLETYCSISALLHKEERLRDFFTRLRGFVATNDVDVSAGYIIEQPQYRQRWEDYLTAFARGLYPVYLLLERDIILGGDLAPYLNEQDLYLLEDKIISLSAFPTAHGFIHKATVQKESALIGAGLFFIRKEREQISSLL